MTSYVVLREQKVGSNVIEPVPDAPADVPAFRDALCWMIAGPPVEAVSAEAAIRKAVKDKGGTYVAVPMRSWSPVTVQVETTRVLKLVGSEA